MLKMMLVAFAVCLSVSSFANAALKTELYSQGDLKSQAITSALYSEVELNKIDGIQDFTFHNQSYESICVLNLSPSYSTNWEENILSSAVQSGQSLKITVNGYASHCEFDIRVVSCSGAKVERSLNLCQVSNFTVQ